MIRIAPRLGVLDTTLCDEICQWLTTGQWLSTGTKVASTNKTERHDITEIFWKVALNIIDHTTKQQSDCLYVCFFKIEPVSKDWNLVWKL